MYFFVGRESVPIAQPSRERTFVASDRTTRAQGSGTLLYEIPPAAGHNKRRPICDGNLAPTESQISYI